MNAIRYTLSITTETLHIDSIPALLEKVISEIKEESISGVAEYEDGDNVSWECIKDVVEF